MHRMTLKFSIFKDQSWDIIFGWWIISWVPACPEKLGRNLLDRVYGGTLGETFAEINRLGGGTTGIDIKTNAMSKSIFNVIFRAPEPISSENLKPDENRNTTSSVGTKLKNVMGTIDANLGLWYSILFVSDSCNIIRDFKNSLQQEQVVKWE